MLISGLKDEDFVNYKKCSMFIGAAYCDFKCCKEAGISESTCQNQQLATSKRVDICTEDLVKRYLRNGMSEAVVFGGLEPMLQIDDVCEFLYCLRYENQCNDDVVIYTGYFPNEVIPQLKKLIEYKNIIVKFGRYEPNQEPHYDDLLGVYLASNRQKAIKVC